MENSAKWSAYFSSLTNFACLYALFGTISMIKEPVSQQRIRIFLNILRLLMIYSGIMDSMIFIGIILGMIYGAFYPIQKIVNVTTMFTFATCVFMTIQLLGSIYPQHALIIFCFCRLAVGFFFYATVLVQSIANYHFRSQQDQKWMQIWYSSGALGQVFAILLGQLIMNRLGLNWKIYVAIITGFIVISAVYLYVANEQILIRNEQHTTTVKQNCLEALQYYRIKQNLLQTLIFLIIDSQYYAMMLWLPYFFEQLGYSQASFLSISYSCAFPFGAIISQPLQILFKNHLGKFFWITFTISTLLYFSLCLLGDDPSQALAYVVLIFVSSSLVSGFNCYTATSDINKRTNNDHQYLLINSTNRTAMRIFQVFHLILTGILMQNDIRGFLKYSTGMMTTSAILLTLRLIVYPKSYQQVQQQISSLEENAL